MMEKLHTLDRLIKRDEDRDLRRNSEVSEDLKKVIDRTRANIRAAFSDGKPAKATLKR